MPDECQKNARGMPEECQRNASRHHVHCRTSTLQYVHWTEQRSSQGVHGTGAIDNVSPYQSSSYVNLERIRCLSCKILEKPTPHWTWHKPTTPRTSWRRSKLIPSRRHHFHVHTRKPAIKTKIGGYVLDDHITTRASSKADLAWEVLYTACRIQTNVFRLLRLQEQIFLFTKLKTRRQCTCTFTYFSLTLALSSPLQTF